MSTTAYLNIGGATKGPIAGLSHNRPQLRKAESQGLRTALRAHFDTHQLRHACDGFKAARDKGRETAIKRAKE